jgi:hypothetical protein
MSGEFTPSRSPSQEERELLGELVARAVNVSLPQGWLDDLRVTDMRDGGMGSLFLVTNKPAAERRFGRRVAELQFRDLDGVDVIVSLNVDQDDVPYELDVWKTDFSPLKGFHWRANGP